LGYKKTKNARLAGRKTEGVSKTDDLKKLKQSKAARIRRLP